MLKLLISLLSSSLLTKLSIVKIIILKDTIQHYFNFNEYMKFINASLCRFVCKLYELIYLEQKIFIIFTI
jgi:predicted AAA+ superfamily ATPase